MGYKVKPFTMRVRNNSTQEFEDVGLLGSDVGSAIKSKNVTITLPSSVTVNANTKANILTDFDLSNLIPNITRIIGFDLEWSSGAVAFASNKYVSGDKTITMDVVAIAPVVISAVRLTVWYR